MAGVASAVLAAALVGYALVVEPVWGWWYMRRLRRRVRVDDDARVDGYRLIIATEWTLAGCALLAYALSDLAPHEVFLTLPRVSGEVPVVGHPGFLTGVVAGLVGGAVFAGVAATRGQAPPVAGDIDVLLPRTQRERRWFAGVALTAGICEEVLYRGVLLVVAALLLPAVPVWVLALGVAGVFGLAHVYQGAAGVVVTTMMGAVLGLLVVATGSLLPAVVAHAALDLRALFAAPRAAAPAQR